jgi:uncharacterized membrane protein HdeD (DUF308 family)
MTFLLIGVLAIVSSVLEMLEGLRAPDYGQLRSAYLGCEVSILAGILLISVPALVFRGLALLLAATFCIDGLGKLGASVRSGITGGSWSWLALTGILNIVAVG